LYVGLFLPTYGTDVNAERSEQVIAAVFQCYVLLLLLLLAGD
jgi:hypothetical protein